MNRNTVLVPVVLSLLSGVAAGSGALYFFVKSRVGASGGAGGESASTVASTKALGNADSPGKNAIRECDERAAHPQDPDAVSAGVEDESLDAEAVIAACEGAVGADPDAPRLKFQLARGYLAAGQVEDAAEQLVAAAESGHGGAMAYLADMHLDGAGTIEADPELAATLYEKAAQAGFKPAEAVLAELAQVPDDATTTGANAGASAAVPIAQAAPSPPRKSAAPPKYINPEIVDNIQRGDLDAVPFGELYTKSYLVNMADNISAACEGAHFTRRDLDQLKLDAAFKTVELTPQAGLNNLMGALFGIANMVQNPGAHVQQGVRAEMDANALPEEAMKDAFALVSHHSCGSPEIDRFGKNLRAYIVDEGAPRMSTDQLFGKCANEARPTGRYDAQNFCMCFTGLMSQAPVSRATRKALAGDFWKTAQEIMAQNPSRYGACLNGWN
jgi:hypothetical protein